MFGFFKKKEPAAKRKEKVWISEAAKFKALATEKAKDPGLIIICWFADTREKAGSFISAETGPNPLPVLYSEIHPSTLSGNRVIFAEHYPLILKEIDFTSLHQIEDAETWSSLDEPMFFRFGGERLIGLMQKLGMKEDEPLEHPMITGAVGNMQEKLQKKVIMELSANSQEDWLKINLPG